MLLAIAVFAGGYVLGAATIFAVVLQRPNMAGYLKTVNFDNDVVFTWNGTTSGVHVPSYG